MSESKPAPVTVAEAASGLATNPAYPSRVHIHERPHWQGVLASCESRVGDYARRLAVLGPEVADRPRLERLHAQMLGARDQVADAARRLPGEVGSLYEDDKHRLEEAVAALDRVARRWEEA